METVKSLLRLRDQNKPWIEETQVLGSKGLSLTLLDVFANLTLPPSRSLLHTASYFLDGL